MPTLTKTESVLLIGFMAGISLPLLYLSRQLDNNTISSWRWVFSGQSSSAIIFFCLLAVAFSYLLAKATFFEKHAVFWLFSFSFIVCVSLWGEPELLLDSGRYFLQAKHVSQHGVYHFIRQWGDGIQAWTDMPLVPLLYGMLFTVFGENRVVIQLFNSLLFSLSAVFTLLSAQILIGKESCFYAGLLLLGMPYLLIQVPLFLVDIHALFFFSLALYTFLVALKDGGTNKILWAATAILLALVTKYSTWPMLLILPLLAVSLRFPEPIDRLHRSALIFLVAALLASVVFMPKLPVIAEQISILRTYQGPALLEWHEGLSSTFLFQIHPFITLFAGVAFFRVLRGGNGPLLVIGIFLLIFCLQIPRSRYIIPLLPLLAIMAAKGVEILQFQETRRFVCWLSVSFAFIIIHCAYLPFFQGTGMSNIQKAGAYLDTLGGDTVVVATLPQLQSKAPTFITVPQLDLFTQKKIAVLENWLPVNKRPQGYHPLKFIWNIEKPSYYDLPPQGNTPLVVISAAPMGDLFISNLKSDNSAKTVKRFSAKSRVFRYQTFVTVIH